MKQIAWVLAILVVVGGGYWFLQQSQNSAQSDDGTTMAQDAVDDANTAAPTGATLAQGATGNDAQLGGAKMGVVVSFDGTAFTPAEVTIKKGQTVTFESTGAPMWVASGPHPMHTGYDGTSRDAHCATGVASSFDQCSAGTRYTFTFDKVGTWPYHNHVRSSVYGKVIVVE